MLSGQEAIDRLCDPEAGVSAHYVVEEDGRIFRLVEEQRRAAHAGVSFWRGREDLNDSSVGIEIVNPGHEWGYRRFPPRQVETVRSLCLSIMRRHPVPHWRVIGHSDVAPDRKQDPGELFPWQALARAGVGFWPEGAVAEPRPTAPDGPADLPRLCRALAAIGYRAEERTEMDEDLATTVRAFQRHWRPDRVDGRADPLTCRRADEVAAGLARLEDRRR